MSLPETEAVRGPFTGLSTTPGIYSIDSDHLIVISNDWDDDHLYRVIVWNWVGVDEHGVVHPKKAEPSHWMVHRLAPEGIFMDAPWFRLRTLGGY